MTPKTLIAMSLAVTLPSLALAGERAIEIPVGGDTLSATLIAPDDDPDAPVVLMLPAFGVPKDGLPIEGTGEKLFERAATSLSEAGFASLRIDYRGTGESGGAPSDVTLQRHVEDGIAALDWIKDQADAHVSFAVLGWSMGGAIAPAVARGADADALIMLNPALDLGPAFTFGIGVDQMRAALAEGATADLPGAEGASATPLPAAFLRSTLEILPQADLALFEGPVFMAAGTQDAIVFPQPELAEAALSYHSGPHELMVQPMDHFFNIAKGSGQSDAVFEAVGRFLETALMDRVWK